MITKRNRPIRKVSKSRAKLLREYQKVKAEFFDREKFCFVCGGEIHPWYGELHHFYKRKGKLLCWEPGFRLAHPKCHKQIHLNETLARMDNWLAPKEACDDFRRAQAHHERTKHLVPDTKKGMVLYGK